MGNGDQINIFFLIAPSDVFEDCSHSFPLSLVFYIKQQSDFPARKIQAFPTEVLCK